jgi:hypothetical protein
MNGFKGFFGKFGLVVATAVVTTSLAGTGVASAVAAVPNNSVTSPKIVNNSVKSADIRDNSVHSIDVTDGNLTGVDIADDTVGGGDVTDGSITSADIGDGAVSTLDVLDGNLTGADILNGSIGLTDLAPTAVTRWAKVDADVNGATMIRGRGAVGATRVSAGQYAVTFLQDVDQCGWSATANDNGTGAAGALFATVELDGPNADNVLRVRTFDAAGALVDPTNDDGFTVTVNC